MDGMDWGFGVDPVDGAAGHAEPVDFTIRTANSLAKIKDTSRRHVGTVPIGSYNDSDSDEDGGAGRSLHQDGALGPTNAPRLLPGGIIRATCTCCLVLTLSTRLSPFL